MTTNVEVTLPESASWDVDVTASFGNTKTITRMKPGESTVFYCHGGQEIHVREIQHESDEYKAEQEDEEFNDLTDDDGPVDDENPTAQEQEQTAFGN